MSLMGTVPACFIGKEYNIPVCLWLLDSYPKDPPVCFVKPPKEMMIVRGQYTDANGQIDLPYLQEWTYPQSDLLGLIQVLTVVFGEEPPVCVRPPNANPDFVQGDWDFHLPKPASWQTTEVVSPPDKETHFTLAREDGVLIPSETEC
ncbi:tumor susceptibility gene 101 protein [Conger conger]|nr:tumor susceptibility gene 101 protein [Conger conger]